MGGSPLEKILLDIGTLIVTGSLLFNYLKKGAPATGVSSPERKGRPLKEGSRLLGKWHSRIGWEPQISGAHGMVEEGEGGKEKRGRERFPKKNRTTGGTLVGGLLGGKKGLGVPGAEDTGRGS